MNAELKVAMLRVAMVCDSVESSHAVLKVEDIRFILRELTRLDKTLYFVFKNACPGYSRSCEQGIEVFTSTNGDMEISGLSYEARKELCKNSRDCEHEVKTITSKHGDKGKTCHFPIKKQVKGSRE